VSAATDPAVRPERELAKRLPAMIAVVALHIVLYYIVSSVNGGRPAATRFDFSLPIDDRIPFVPSSSFVYYLGDAYILLWGAYILSRLTPSGFRLATTAYAWMIVVGALIQLALPARAPWPADPAPMQAWVHDAIALRPMACLPSMHVALSVLPAALSLSVLQQPVARCASVGASVLISASTLTLKEHYFLDVLAGALLGLAAYWFWLAASHRDRSQEHVATAEEVS
jgi:membrane-associated phospholipid phosphatase